MDFTKPLNGGFHGDLKTIQNDDSMAFVLEYHDYHGTSARQLYVS